MAKHSHPIPETVTALAARLGIGRTHLSEVLNRNTLPSIRLAKRIEDATGIAWTSWFAQDPRQPIPPDPSDTRQARQQGLDAA